MSKGDTVELVGMFKASGFCFKKAFSASMTIRNGGCKLSAGYDLGSLS